MCNVCLLYHRGPACECDVDEMCLSKYYKIGQGKMFFKKYIIMKMPKMTRNAFACSARHKTGKRASGLVKNFTEV